MYIRSLTQRSGVGLRSWGFVHFLCRVKLYLLFHGKTVEHFRHLRIPLGGVLETDKFHARWCSDSTLRMAAKLPKCEFGLFFCEGVRVVQNSGLRWDCLHGLLLILSLRCLGSLVCLPHFWHTTPPLWSDIMWCPFSSRPCCWGALCVSSVVWLICLGGLSGGGLVDSPSRYFFFKYALSKFWLKHFEWVEYAVEGQRLFV